MNDSKVSRSFRIFLILILPLIIGFADAEAIDFHDAVADFTPEGNGFELLAEYVGLLRQSSANLRYDQRTGAFLDFWSSNLRKFQFKRLYSSHFLADLSDGFRVVAFQGRHYGDSYRISMNLPEKVKDFSRPLDSLGSVNLELGLKKNVCRIVKGNSFTFRARMTSLRNEYSFDGILSILEGFQKVVTPGNLETLSHPECYLFKRITEPDSRRIINAFHQTFTNVSIFFNRYFIFDSLMQVKNAQPDYSQFNLKCWFNREALAKDFPEIIGFLDRLNNLMRFELEYKTTGGLVLMQISIDSLQKVIQVKFKTGNGNIIPWQTDGSPVIKESLSLANVRNYRLYAVFNVFLNVRGLKFRSGDFTVQVDYGRSEDVNALDFKLIKVQPASLTGRVYHIVPAWVFDLFIPGDVNMLIYNFYQVMLREGQGSYFMLEWDKSRPEQTIMNMNAVAELLDNFFIRFGAGIFHYQFSLDRATISQMRLFQDRFQGAFLSDLQRNMRH